MVFKNQHAQSNVHKDALFQALEFQHCGLTLKLMVAERLCVSGGISLKLDGFA